MIFTDLLLIALIVVFIVDYSGFVQDGLEPLVKKITGAKIGHIGKPLNCSFCMNFYVGLIYLLIAGEMNLFTLAYLLFLSAMTPVFNSLLHLLIDFFESVITEIYRFFNL